jgi:galactose mutarotase-like enzyme
MSILQNDSLKLAVNLQGAELTSVRDLKDDTEYLWQADPSFWGRHAPVLFPIVGRLKDDQFQHRGQAYHLTQHGFARDLPFVPQQAPEGSLTYRLQATPETKQRYPFDFQLDITYTLEGRDLRVAYEVSNLGAEPMPFSIGAHPAFRCPLVAGERFEDYDFVLAQAETVDRHLLAGGLYTGEVERVLPQGDHLPLEGELFQRDALVFHDLASEWVALRSRQSGREVRMYIAGFPYFGLWTKPGAPFVCLEPWQGLADYQRASGHLSDKVGIILLMPEQTHRASYRVSFQ